MLTTQQAFDFALQHHRAGRLAEAEAFYRQILVHYPHHSGAWHMLGVIALQTGNHDKAVDRIRYAIQLDPAEAGAHSNLGEALRALGHLDEAVASYRKAIELQADYPEAWNNLGIGLGLKGELHDAVAAFRTALRQRPGYPDAHYNLGNALKDLGQFKEAEFSYRQAILLRPEYAEAYNNLGLVLTNAGRLDEAVDTYRHALSLKPSYWEACKNLGAALRAKGHLAEATTAYHLAVRLNPNSAESHNDLSVSLSEAGNIDEAIMVCRQALQLRPNFPEAQCNLGNLLADSRKIDEALAAYHQLLQSKPDFAPATFGESLVRLLCGDFERGWPLYETRMDAIPSLKRDFPQPIWKGEPLNGQRILVHAEQGFGDTLQFIRYASLVALRGGRVIVECQSALRTLLESVEGISELISKGEPLPYFELHCPMASLPFAFGTRLETIPAAIPYIGVDRRKTVRWRERLACEPALQNSHGSSQHCALKVGLVWAGGARPDEPDAARNDRRRSLLLSQLAPLGGVAGVVFVSLQKGDPAAQAHTPPEGMTLLDWTDELHDFSDTAALVECLDLVISVDTAVAHLAGALGKLVWVLNRFDGCWRWLLEREDSPWYPTMRLFRQQTFGDWTPVILRLAEELRRLSERHSANPSESSAA